MTAAREIWEKHSIHDNYMNPLCTSICALSLHQLQDRKSADKMDGDK
jgi:hypothetical protein